MMHCTEQFVNAIDPGDATFVTHQDRITEEYGKNSHKYEPSGKKEQEEQT